MPKYLYVAKTKDAKTIKDVEIATSQEEVVAKLRARGFFIISVKELIEKKDGGGSLLATFFPTLGKKRQRVSVKLLDLTLLARNLAVTLSSGITLLRSIEILSSQCESARLKKILGECGASVKEGLSFSEAIAKYPKIFSTLWRSIVEVGEASGNLPFGLEKLADYLDLRMEFERKIKTALLYPGILLFAGFTSLFVFFKFILPKFVDIFTQFSMELPVPTQVVFAISNFFGRWWLVMIGLVVGLGVAIAYFRDEPEFKRRWDKLSLRLPLLGGMISLTCLERFTSTMYILLDSGLPLVYTLEIAARSIGNSLLERDLMAVKERVREGASLSAEMATLEVFPPLISEMTKVGEETGTMPDIFNKMSHYYQREVGVRVERLVAVFEPLMILFLGVIIGGIVVSLFLPLFKLSSIGTGM